MKEVLRGFKKNRVATDPTAADHRLRGRTYTIPFEAVWQASVALSGGGLPRWSIVNADDQSGQIEARYRTLFFGLEIDVWIVVGLDEDAQTRVDVQASARTERTDLGRTKSVIRYFFRRLDRKLGALPSQILDPTQPRAWREPS